MSAHLCPAALEDLNVPTSVCTGTRQSSVLSTNTSQLHITTSYLVIALTLAVILSQVSLRYVGNDVLLLALRYI